MTVEVCFTVLVDVVVVCDVLTAVEVVVTVPVLVTVLVLVTALVVVDDVVLLVVDEVLDEAVVEVVTVPAPGETVIGGVLSTGVPANEMYVPVSEATLICPEIVFATVFLTMFDICVQVLVPVS